MLAYGKNKPRNNQFSGVFCPEKVKYYPKYKSAQISLKIYPKTQICPVTESSIITLTATQPDPNNAIARDH